MFGFIHIYCFGCFNILLVVDVGLIVFDTLLGLLFCLGCFTVCWLALLRWWLCMVDELVGFLLVAWCCGLDLCLDWC